MSDFEELGLSAVAFVVVTILVCVAVVNLFIMWGTALVVMVTR